MNNLSTIVVTAIIALIVVMIIYKGIKNKRQGKGSCGCGCSGCSMADVCHKKDEQ